MNNSPSKRKTTLTTEGFLGILVIVILIALYFATHGSFFSLKTPISASSRAERPFKASTTSTAASRAQKERSISAEKSVWKAFQRNMSRDDLQNIQSSIPGRTRNAGVGRDQTVLVNRQTGAAQISLLYRDPLISPFDCYEIHNIGIAGLWREKQILSQDQEVHASVIRISILLEIVRKYDIIAVFSEYLQII